MEPQGRKKIGRTEISGKKQSLGNGVEVRKCWAV